MGILSRVLNPLTRDEEQQLEAAGEMYNLDKRLHSVIRRVAELTEQCDRIYSSCVKTNAWNGSAARNMVAALQECITLSAKDKEYWTEESRIWGNSYPHNYFKAYIILAKVYEKQENYALAIETCCEAIKKGYTDDGTKGGMRGRIERLEKKMKVKPNAIAQK